MKVSRLTLCIAGLLMWAGSASATLNQGTLSGNPVTLYCVDFENHVGFGQSWLANLTVIDGSMSLGNTRYGALTLYQEAAWLGTQYATHPNDYGDILRDRH